MLAGLLAEAGFMVHGPLVIPDGDPVETALRDAVAARYDVVVTTGGTGLTPGYLTPEMTRRVLDREIPGIAEAIRAAGAAAGIPAANAFRPGLAWPAACSSSTCLARQAGCGTGWPCSGRFSRTRWTRPWRRRPPAPGGVTGFGATLIFAAQRRCRWCRGWAMRIVWRNDCWFSG